MSGFVFPVVGGGSTSSGYGQRRAPTAGASSNHGGIDIRGTVGTPIVATNRQRVTSSRYSSSYGNVVYAVDDNGYQHRYAHLNSRTVSAGDTLSAGQQLGTLGSTGRSTGPHLHYEVRDKSGKALNPSGLLNKAKKLISSDAMRAGLAAATGGASEAVLGVVPDSLNPFGGGQSWLDQLKSWIADSGFFQRIALALFAFILLFAAFYLFKSGPVQNAIAQATK